MELARYDRTAAVAYAHRWAYGRNPQYYNFEALGGDCSNFISQCLYAGALVMDFTPTYGWYYLSANDRAPAWTGVVYLYNYLTRSRAAPGPAAQDAAIHDMLPGDVIQISYDAVRWVHSMLVVSLKGRPTPENILVAAHSYDADDRPLATYEYARIRFLHVYGVYRP